MQRVNKFFHALIEDNTRLTARIFNLVMIALIILSMAVWLLDTNKAIAADWGPMLHRIEYYCMLCFIAEYCLRVLAYQGPIWKFFISPMSIIDVLAVAPFFVTGSSNTAALRVLRIFRVFRIFKLARYSDSLQRLLRVFKENMGILGVFLFVVVVILFISAALMHALEPQRFGQMTDALWWSIVTLTTVGYGDLVPETAWGKLIAAILMLFGIGIIALPTGILGASLTRLMLDEEKLGSVTCTRCGQDKHLTEARFCNRCGEKLI